MKRYQNIGRFDSTPSPSLRRYVTTKYPEISRSFEDIYVYTAMGDRYDILALSYYGDSTLWWIISSANPEYGKDSLIPPRGIQLRIPAPIRTAEIISQFDSINN